jgi:integrase
MRDLSIHETADILQINLTTLTGLVNDGLIPFTRLPFSNGETIRFNPDMIDQWGDKKPLIIMNDKKYIESFKKRFAERYPETIQQLKEYDSHFTAPRVPKGYYLCKVKNKKLGFVFYVRYIKDGKLVPSNYCTHTNDKEAAERFAVENRERILTAYYSKSVKREPQGELYSILKKYYAKNSPYLEVAAKRGRSIAEKSRVTYHNFITKQFIPYLRKEKIKKIVEIDTPFLARFQNHLLAGTRKKQGIKPQTIAHYISYISQVFDHLLIEGHIKTNPCTSLPALKVQTTDCVVRGCYEIDKLKGVFNKRWNDELSYLLCLIIYTTGMRNGEIERIRVKDIVEIDGCHFIDIPVSKSKNGIRMVPLHDFVYKKLTRYIIKNKKTNNDKVFIADIKTLGSKVYDKANFELARFTEYTAEKLEQENITFYSGRHFWKTLMNSENLGEVEEVFIGHKVTQNVAQRYNHRDKQGKKKFLEKTRKVFKILDKRVFASSK